jgi:microcystin-dependent protein
MALTPIMGEIVMYAFNFPPKGWAMCNGQLMPINQNQALFSLLGTTYGGDGRVNFALPDMRGRSAMYTSASHILGERGGQEAHTITMSEMPQHIHMMNAYNGNADSGAAAVPATNNSFANNAFAVPAGGGSTPVNRYSNTAASGTLIAGAVTNVGGSQAHQNRQPYLTINFCIALQGVFPSRN